MNSKQQVYRHLEERSIKYALSEHPPVYTIEEMEQLGLNQEGLIVKNLFLRDAKGKRHFLIMLHKDKKVNLKDLQQKIGSTGLRFASPERLSGFLGLEKGAVSPFGVLNDAERAVEVIFDRNLIDENLLGVHPNDNTATVWLAFADLQQIIEEHGNIIKFLDI